MTNHLELALALGQYDIDPERDALLIDEQSAYADFAALSAVLAAWDDAQASEASSKPIGTGDAS